MLIYNVSLCLASSKVPQGIQDLLEAPRVPFPCTQRLAICGSLSAVYLRAEPSLQGLLKMPQVGSSRRESLQNSQPHPTIGVDHSHPNWVSYIDVAPFQMFYPVNDRFQTNLRLLKVTGFKGFIHTFNL